MKEIISSIKHPRVAVILWTTSDERKRAIYKEKIRKLFKSLGVGEIKFIEGGEAVLENVNILYLPGGDTEFFISKLKENPEIIEKIRKFSGIILATSAGAIVLCKRGYSRDKSYIGLGILSINIRVHFTQEDLKRVSGEEELWLSEEEYVRILKPVEDR
jgi:cobyrinic acid a,c-diamide synthase